MPFAWLRRWRRKKGGTKQETDEQALLERLRPDMPDFMQASHEPVFRSGSRLGILVRDVPTIAERLLGAEAIPAVSRFTFPFALVVIDLDSGLPERIVALERGPLGTLCLCMYAGGAHLNFGEGEPYLDREAFLARALQLIGEAEGLHPYEVSGLRGA